jgi:hypothetical protein
MKTCEQCGLPIWACNTLAAYREAKKYARLGRHEEAERYFIVAEECYEDRKTVNA